MRDRPPGSADRHQAEPGEWPGEPADQSGAKFRSRSDPWDSPGHPGLASAFGVAMRNWWAEDARAGDHDRLTQNPAFLLFTRENRLLREHPITDGRNSEERVNVVDVHGSGHDCSRGRSRAAGAVGDRPRVPVSAIARIEVPFGAGLAQAVALTHGSGRVVIFGEAAALTAQASRRSNGELHRFGINRGDLDNAQLVLNVMHWLTGLL